MLVPPLPLKTLYPLCLLLLCPWDDDVSGFLGNCGLEVTLNEGKGVLCLIGIGVMGFASSISAFTFSQSSSSVSWLSFLLGFNVSSLLCPFFVAC